MARGEVNESRLTPMGEARNRPYTGPDDFLEVIGILEPTNSEPYWAWDETKVCPHDPHSNEPKL